MHADHDRSVSFQAPGRRPPRRPRVMAHLLFYALLFGFSYIAARMTTTLGLKLGFGTLASSLIAAAAVGVGVWLVIAFYNRFVASQPLDKGLARFFFYEARPPE